MNKIITIILTTVFVLSPVEGIAEDNVPEHMPQFSTYQEYGQYLVVEKWGEEQWSAFYEVINRESSWRITTAHYPSGYTSTGIKSSAHGLAGFLDATWSSVGCEKTDNGFIQVECATLYIEARYGTPSEALAYHNLKGHY